MNGDGTPLPEAVLEDMAYLSRSENRLQILDLLSTATRTPREIVAETDTPRSTLRRILTELEEREWAERTNDGEYHLTGTGDLVATETGRYVGALRAIEALGEAVNWLPNEELTIGLHLFADATVLGAEANDVVGADTRLIELMRDADEFYCLTNTAGTVGLETEMMDRFADGDMTVGNVITPAELAIYRDDADRAARWREYVEAGANVCRHDGPIPCNTVIVDETVLIGDRHLETVGMIESTDEAVRSWAGDMFDAYSSEAERLDPTAFTPEASTVRETPE